MTSCTVYCSLCVLERRTSALTGDSQAAALFFMTDVRLRDSGLCWTPKNLQLVTKEASTFTNQDSRWFFFFKRSATVSLWLWDFLRMLHTAVALWCDHRVWSANEIYCSGSSLGETSCVSVFKAMHWGVLSVAAMSPYTPTKSSDPQVLANNVDNECSFFFFFNQIFWQCFRKWNYELRNNSFLMDWEQKLTERHVWNINDGFCNAVWEHHSKNVHLGSGYEILPIPINIVTTIITIISSIFYQLEPHEIFFSPLESKPNTQCPASKVGCCSLHVMIIWIYYCRYFIPQRYLTLGLGHMFQLQFILVSFYINDSHKELEL